MILETERLTLRPYKKDDWERVHLYGSLLDFSQYDAWGPNSIEDSQNFIQFTINENNKAPQQNYEFAIIENNSGLLVGGCSLKKDYKYGSVASFGYAINPDFQGRGYATEASQELIELAFKNLGLRVLYATCDTRNIASYSVMEKLGMKRIDHIKAHKKIRGHMRDSYCYELINK